jgi:hypothetical protein
MIDNRARTTRITYVGLVRENYLISKDKWGSWGCWTYSDCSAVRPHFLTAGYYY